MDRVNIDRRHAAADELILKFIKRGLIGAINWPPSPLRTAQRPLAITQMFHKFSLKVEQLLHLDQDNDAYFLLTSSTDFEKFH